MTTTVLDLVMKIKDISEKFKFYLQEAALKTKSSIGLQCNIKPEKVQNS